MNKKQKNIIVKLVLVIILITGLLGLLLLKTNIININKLTEIYNDTDANFNIASIYNNILEKYYYGAKCIQCNSWSFINQLIYIKPHTISTNNYMININNDTNNIGISTIKANNTKDYVFKIELGLAGPTTISFYHPLTDKYIAVSPDLSLYALSFNDIANAKDRSAASFIPYVIYKAPECVGDAGAGAIPHNKNIIYAFKSHAYAEANSNYWLSNNNKIGMNLKLKHTSTPDPINIDDIHWNIINITDINIAAKGGKGSDTPDSDNNEEYLGEYYNYYNDSKSYKKLANEGFTNRPTEYRGTRNKKNILGLLNVGMINDSEYIEMFDNGASIKPDLSVSEIADPDFNPAKADIFAEHTGLEFNDILNHYYSAIQRDSTDDRLFDKLENAKLDPNVQNLLDYNEERFKIHMTENNELEKKTQSRLATNTDMTNALIQRLDQHRIRELAKRMFFLENTQ